MDINNIPYSCGDNISISEEQIFKAEAKNICGSGNIDK